MSLNKLTPEFKMESACFKVIQYEKPVRQWVWVNPR